MVLPLTYFVTKRVKLKWFVSLAGTLASIVVLVGGIAMGAFSWTVYWVGFKNADITEARDPVSSTEALFDPAVWAILVPIITPMFVLIPIMLKWKKLGAAIGANWS